MKRFSRTLTHSIRYRASSGRRCCLPFAVKPIVCQNFPCTNTTYSNTQRWSLAVGIDRSSHFVLEYSRLECEAPLSARLESIQPSQGFHCSKIKTDSLSTVWLFHHISINVYWTAGLIRMYQWLDHCYLLISTMKDIPLSLRFSQ